ncbi:hypothetical protein [Agrobacterium sp. NPDC090283]|uniref:hypothetical protein n=1 Tax=Agrobacterium sp. NPDC090283 TaxID=3363920 RepID=UPI00383B0035
MSGRMGAGVTDQTMEMLGFVWRDVAEELIGSSTPLADYLYENAAGALVLAEAKGSISNAASQTGVNTRARNAYHRQVDPYVYTHPPGPKGAASIGLIEHGYAVALAALPGPTTPSPPVITADAFLAVAETDPSLSSSPLGASSGGGVTSTTSSPNLPLKTPMYDPQRFALRLGNYRGVFLLANAAAVVDAIDSVRLGREPARRQTFLRVQCGNEDFLIGLDPTFPPISALEPYLRGWIFAIALSAADTFLDQLANASNPNFARAMQIHPLVQALADPPRPFLLSPDGFAMLRRDATVATHELIWDAQSGSVERTIPHRQL